MRQPAPAKLGDERTVEADGSALHVLHRGRDLGVEQDVRVLQLARQLPSQRRPRESGDAAMCFWADPLLACR